MLCEGGGMAGGGVPPPPPVRESRVRSVLASDLKTFAQSVGMLAMPTTANVAPERSCAKPETTGCSIGCSSLSPLVRGGW